MAISVFDLFKIGIGPSSSHTVGPMRAARMFAHALDREGLLDATAQRQGELYGSLGATGKGHGSDVAVMLGLMGHSPDTVDVDAVPGWSRCTHQCATLTVLGDAAHCVSRNKEHLLMYRREAMAEHPNGMKFSALDAQGEVLKESQVPQRGWRICGHGGRGQRGRADRVPEGAPSLYLGRRVAGHVQGSTGLRISQVMWANERTWRSDEEIRAGLLNIWHVMRECVQRGLSSRARCRARSGYSGARRCWLRACAIAPSARWPTRCRCWTGSTSMPLP